MKDFIDFLNNSPTSWQATDNIVKMLGFANENTITDKKGNFLINRKNSLMAWKRVDDGPFKIIAAHTDSPCLKVNPRSDRFDKYNLVDVSVYGSPILRSWLDIELGLAGVAYTKDLKEVLLDFKKPLAFIPSLAIHLDKENEIKASQMIPIIDVKLSELLKDYLSYDLSFYPFSLARLVGSHDKFLMSARLDNLSSCFVACKALDKAKRNTLIYLVNNEECGSVSKDGAFSLFTSELAKLNKDSFVISLDSAHGFNPVFSDKYNSNHAPILGGGIVVKVNSNLRYATSAKMMAIIEKTAKSKDIPIQYFVSKLGSPCGSTIGPHLSAKLDLEVVDLGIPTLAMHSSREVIDVNDFENSLNLISEL